MRKAEEEIQKCEEKEAIMERHKVIQIRVSPKEKGDMTAKAKSIGLSISEWLRKIAKEWAK